MKVLIACEESQRVCIEFRKLGHEAWSCDLGPCSGGHEEWHIQSDVLSLLNGNCKFETMDGVSRNIDGEWDMIIAFPPCTYLTSAGNRWFDVKKYGEKAIRRMKDREDARKFFLRFVQAKCKKIAIENPVGVMSSEYRKPDCIIEPYWFGDRARKRTCLWLKGLRPLVPTNIVDYGELNHRGQSRGASADYAVLDGKILAWNDPRTAKIRSKTFPGVARAMAEQWGGGVNED